MCATAKIVWLARKRRSRLGRQRPAAQYVQAFVKQTGWSIDIGSAQPTCVVTRIEPTRSLVVQANVLKTTFQCLIPTCL